MENQKIDFEFGWWVSMTPALVVAVYFVSRWNQNHNETVSLAIAVASLILGLVATSIICHPNFNGNADQAKENEAGQSDSPWATAAQPGVCRSGRTLSQEPVAHEQNAAQADPASNKKQNFAVPGMFTADDIPFARQRSSVFEEDGEPAPITVEKANPVDSAINGEGEFFDASDNEVDMLRFADVGEQPPLSSGEVDAAIAAIHAACCAEELQRFWPAEAEASDLTFAPISEGINLKPPADTTFGAPPSNDQEKAKSPEQEVRSLRDKLLSASTGKPVTDISIDQAAVESWFAKGMSLVQTGNFRDALYCFSFVLQQDANHLPSLTTKAICLFQMKRYDDALRAFEQVQAIDANDTRAREGIAATLKRIRAAAGEC
jgi:tetratricopeptide (TPR) repeat protein